MPRWLDHVATRTPLTRMPRQVVWLKPSRKSSISAYITSSRMALADWSTVHHHSPLEWATAPATASARSSWGAPRCLIWCEAYHNRGHAP
jgi:hypothetical protein